MRFDEPASTVDLEPVEQVLSLMKQLVNERSTMVKVTHETGFTSEIADRLLFIDGGVIGKEASCRSPESLR